MCLERYIRNIVKLGDYKKEQLAILNYVKRLTQDGPHIILIEEKEWGNVPPILFQILYEKGCFAESTTVPALSYGYFGLSDKGEEYRQKLEQELKEN